MSETPVPWPEHPPSSPAPNEDAGHPAGPTLAAGLSLAAVAMVFTHPVAVVTALVLSVVYAHRTGALAEHRLLGRLAVGLAVAVLAFNGLFSWNGATVLYQAPFRIALLGRPIFTLEALIWGAIAGLQLAATTLALGAATLSVPPERLHRALARAGAPGALATAAGLALRLVPETGRDAKAMGRALRTRGLETQGVRGTSHVLVPLTARALDRAALAEEALTLRGYAAAGGGRVWGAPAAPALIGVLAVVLAGLVAFLGPGRASYYPLLGAALDPASLGLILGVLALPALLVMGVRPSSR